MSNHTEPGHPVTRMIRHITSEIFRRIYSGTNQYSSDVKTLLHYVEIAKTVDDQRTVAHLYNMIAIVEVMSGTPSKAVAYQEKAYRIYAELQDTERMAQMASAKGETARLTGRYQDALQHYDAALALYAQGAPAMKSTLTHSNRGLTCLALGDYVGATDSFNQALAIIGDDTAEAVDALMEAKRGLAEVYLERGELITAWNYAREAEELARGIQDNVTWVEILLTMAHLAEVDPHPPQNASAYYAKARELLQQQQSPVMTGRAILDEARYQQRRNNAKDAERLAQEAHDIFMSIEMLEEMHNAQAILDALGE